MKFNKILIVCILLAILTMGAVSASDDNATSDSLAVNEDLNVESSVVDEAIAEDSDVGNFSELQTIINSAKDKNIVLDDNYRNLISPFTEFDSMSVVELDKDYVGSGLSINIQKSVLIDGNNHVIDARSLSKIFEVGHDNVIFKDLILKNGKSPNWAGAIDAYGYYAQSGCMGVSAINCTFINCTASNAGGATGMVNSINCCFIDCKAPYYAAGSYDWEMVDCGIGNINCTVINCICADETSIPLYHHTNCIFIKDWSKYDEERTFKNIQNLIDEAGDGDTISLSGYYLGLSFSGMVIDKAITIEGNGATLDAQCYSGIFTVSNDNVVLRNINFINAYTSANGAAVNGDCTIINCTFNNCHGSWGGAVYSVGGNVSNCTFVMCSARNGGGIYGSCQNCDFISCHATTNAALGGGTAVNCTAGNCTSDYGIVYSNSIDSVSSRFVLQKYKYEHSFEYLQELIDNATEGSTVVIPIGGYYGFSSQITINKRLTITGGDNPVSLDGQGLVRIFNITAKNVEIKSISFYRGYSQGNGGAIYSTFKCSMEDCDFYECYSEGNGGAIYSNEGFELYLCDFKSCSAKGDGGAAFRASGRACTFHYCTAKNGGATYAATFENSAFYRCHANNNGGAGYDTIVKDYCNIQYCSADGNGGGLYQSQRSYSATDGSLAHCHSKGNGGAIYGGSTYNIDFWSCISDLGPVAYECDVSNSHFYDCSDTASNLQTLIDKTGDGGVLSLSRTIYVVQGNAIVINKNITIIGDRVTLLGHTNSRLLDITANNVVIKNINFVNATSNVGGAINFIGESLTLMDCNFENCFAKNDAGAVLSSGYVNVINSNFVYCHSGYAGFDGAICAFKGALILNSTFTNCFSKNGIVSLGEEYWVVSGYEDDDAISGLIIINSSFIDCSAISDNFINIEYYPVVLLNSTFISCSGYRNLIYINDTDCQISGCTFTNISSPIYGSNSNLSFVNCIFDNFASIKVKYCNLSVVGCSFTRPDSRYWDTAIDVDYGNASISDCRVENFGGHIVDAQHSNCNVTNSTFTNKLSNTRVLDGVYAFNCLFINCSYADHADEMESFEISYVLANSISDYCIFINAPSRAGYSPGGRNYERVVSSWSTLTNHVITEMYLTQEEFERSSYYIQRQLYRANEGDVFYLSGNYDWHSQINLDRNITFIGNDCTLIGFNKNRAFAITNDNVVIKNINFVNFTGLDDGGAITCDKDWGIARPSIINCTFTNCVSENNYWSNSGSGGAVYGGVCYNSTFIGCYANYCGGALASSKAYNCTFINCSAGTSGGALSWGSANDCIITNCSSPSGPLNSVSTSNCIISMRPLKECAYENSFAYIQDLINNASYGDTINLSGHYYGEKQIEINKKITIVGNNLTLDGQTATRAFILNNGGVILRNITFEHCYNYQDHGGAIYSYGSGFTVENCTFVDCSAHHSSGGAIYSYSCRALVYNSTFIDCSAYHAGAIWLSRSDCIAENCTFINCHALGKGGAVGGYAGAINCTFIGCSAENGGGLYDGDATNCRFVNCSASDTGGAVYDVDYCRNCIFDNCTSLNGGALTECDLYNCTLINCFGGIENGLTVDGVGDIAEGDIVTVEISIKEKLQSDVSLSVDGKDYPINMSGGKIIIKLADLEFGVHTISAVYPGSDYYLPANITKSFKVKHNSRLSVETCNVYVGENAIINIYIDENVSGDFEFRVNWEYYESNLPKGAQTINISDLSEGSYWVYATFEGDDDFLRCEMAVPLIVTSDKDYLEFSNMILKASNGDTVYLEKDYNFNSTFVPVDIYKKVTVDGKGHVVDVNGLSNIFAVHDSDVVLKNIIFANGYGEKCGAINGACSIYDCTFINCSCPGNSYSVGVVNNATVYNSKFINCSVNTEIGVINKGLAINCTFEGCSASNYVGLVYEGSAVNCTFKDFTGGYNSACVYKGSAVNCIFVNCSSNDGAAMYGGSAVNCTFDNCHVNSYGGAMHGGSAVNCTFNNCRSDFDGGAIYEGSAMNCAFINCSCGDDGGAMYSGTAKYSTFKNCHAGFDGGAIYNGYAVDCEFEGCTANYEGNAMYGGFADDCTFINYDKMSDATTRVSLQNCSVKEQANINITPEITVPSLDNLSSGKEIDVGLPADATGTLTLFIDNQSYPFDVSGGKATVKIPELTEGDYDYTISYSGDGRYSSVVKNGVLTINLIKETPEVDIPSLDNLSGDGTVAVRLPADATGTVTLSVNGENYTFDVVNGVADVRIPELENGDYNYTITYSGDSRYSSFKKSGSMNVSRQSPEVEIPSLDNLSGDGTVTVSLPEDATGTVTLSVNGENYTFDVVNGVADVRIPELENGDYNYTITYSGDGKYSSFKKSDSMNVLRASPDVNIPSLESPSDDGTVTVSLPADATGKVTLSVDGKDYTFDVVNGKADVKLPELTDGSHDYTITYSGDAKYLKFTEGGSLTVNKTVPETPVNPETPDTPVTPETPETPAAPAAPAAVTVKLTLKTVAVKKSAKKLILQATLKVNGKAVKGRQIIFKFNGKAYKAKTNAKGIAKVTVKKAVLKKLKVGKKVKYQAGYGKTVVKKSAKIKK